MPKPCRDCGVSLHWVAFETDEQGNFLRDDTGKAITHKCQRQGEGLGQVKQHDGSLPFGKYKGRPIADVVNRDRQYVEWARDHATQQWLKDALTSALGGRPTTTTAAQRIGEGGDDSWDD